MAVGIHIVGKRKPRRPVVWYVYAWRGGPQVHRQEGGKKPTLNPKLVGLIAEAHRKKPVAGAETLNALIDLFLESADFKNLSKDWQESYHIWVPRIRAKFGRVPLPVFNDDRMKEDIVEWRDRWKHMARSADKAIQIFRRILSHGVSPAKLLKINAASCIPNLYKENRSAIIWAPEDIERFHGLGKPWLSDAIDLESCTGLRRKDLARVTWDAVGEHVITWTTSKSQSETEKAKGGERTVYIPILPETRELFARIKARHALEMSRRAPGKRVPLPPTILANFLWRPWSPASLGSGIYKALDELGIDKHLHDLRGNFVTRLAIAGIEPVEIADIVGWSEEEVKRLLRIYVNRDRLAQERAKRIAAVAIA